MFAPAQPFCVGEKLTLKLTVWDAARTRGRFTPVTPNSLPPAVIAEIVTLVAPLFVKVTSWVSVDPISTSPNRTVPGENCSWLGAAAELGRTAQVRKTMMEMVKTEIEILLDWGSLITAVSSIVH